MECEKTKYRKKKKTKQNESEESGSSLESFETDLRELQDLCTDTKLNDQASENIEYIKESEKVEDDTINMNAKLSSENEEFIEYAQPSAPISLEVNCKSSTIVVPVVAKTENLYPDLKLVDQSPSISKTDPATMMKPYTMLQLESLHSNNEINRVSIFETEFIERELKDASLQEHNLYVLLKKYAKSRLRFLKNINDAESSMRKLEQNYKNIWMVENKVASAHGFCSCGRVLRATHNYSYAVFSEEVFCDMEQNMKKLQGIASQNHVKYLQESVLYHRQIEQLINELMNDNVFKDITKDSPITLNEKIDNSAMMNKVNDLRTYISVLFKFLREIPQDKKVQLDVQCWIKQLVSLQLRIATWEDHVFILFHILRLRDGFGSWASCLVQIPSKNGEILAKYELLGTPDFHHCIAVLNIILTPISKRIVFLEDYLKDVVGSKNKSEKDSWILVDSDGEDGNSSSEDYSKLKERDLVMLFDQIPFELVFKTMSYAYKKNGDEYELDMEKICFGHNVIKTIAFSSMFIKILKNGLLNITERHKQFAKRLGKLIKETLFYLGDIISLYQKSTSYKDQQEYQRIQIEYDELVLRSACFIYESKKLGLFQYLADFPYNLMTINAVWKLFYYLQVGDFKAFDEDVASLIFDNSFIENFNHDVAMDDMLFLLHTFAKIALSKGSEDVKLLSFILRNLVHIGFINDYTKDYCYNTAKGLLADITNKFPQLVGEMIAYVKNNIHKIGSLNTYILKSFPINKWTPTQTDLELFSSWLLNYDFDTIESSTARFMIASFNWNFNNDELFLSHETHVRMAYLVCEVYLKYVGESPKSDFNDVKFIGKLTKNATKKEKFSVWCWSMISLLRLHQMDIDPKRIMKNPNILNSVPEFEELSIVYQGAIDNKPLPIYISFLLSRFSHSLPQICHKGFEKLKLLLLDHRYPKVIRCLELTAPLFLESMESLHQCDAFLNILEILIKADKAHGIPKSNDDITVLKLLKYMILNQLNSYQQYGCNTPLEITFLWFNSFLKLKNWNKDEKIVSVLEMICQFAYPFSDVWNMIKETLSSSVQTILTTKLTKTSGFLSFVMSEDPDILFLPFSDAPTLSTIILECEHANIESNTGYWNDLVYQLSVQKDISLENIHKSILQSKQMTYFPLKTLVIFKIVKLICDCSINCFIFPIICQQFFVLYYSRIFIDIANDSRGVQEKFYDYDVALIKKLKRKFEDSEKYHKDMATEETSGQSSHFHMNLSKIFKTFLLWLEETQLNSMLQKNIILPPLYEAQKLKQIFQGNKAHWTEFIDIQELRKVQKKHCDLWLNFCMRSTSHKVFENDFNMYESNDDNDEASISKKIFERLKLSGKSLNPPPELIRKPALLGKIDMSKDSLKLFHNETKILMKSARQYTLTINEHKAVDAVYKDSIRFSFINESTCVIKRVTCSKLLDNCQGFLTLKVEFCQMKSNDTVRLKLDDNREYHRKLIVKELQDCDIKITDANFCLHNIVDQLIEHQSGDQKKRDDVLKLAKSIFYELIGEIDSEILEYPITNEFYTDAITKLASFIQKNDSSEMLNILKRILQQPLIINLFAEIFAPSYTPSTTFISLYDCLMNMYGRNYEPQILFVLISKFDMPTFLQNNRPKLVEVSELVRLIFRGLELWDVDNSELLQDALRCHLVHLFMYRFPEHYGEILQCVLNEFSQQRLRPCILLDILNACYQRIGCSKIDTEMSIGRMRDEMRTFASKQNLLSYNDLYSTALMINHYFYNERLNHGLHGIYPKFGKYCDVLTLLFGTIGHGVISAAIKANPESSADYLVNELYPCLSSMYAPMLIPLCFSQNDTKDTPANWIQQLSSGNTLLQPWSNVQTENAEKFIRTYAMCLQYMFDVLPSSNMLIQHLFTWYLECFAHKTTPKHVLAPIQLLLTKMPFERLLPTLQHLEGMNRILLDFVPECHTFLGNIFLRISWTQYLSMQLQTLEYFSAQRVLAILLMTIVKLSYEPKVRESIRILHLIQEAVKYPWNMLDYKDVENVLDWFVMSTEPSVILKIPSEHEMVDVNVHLLLQTASNVIDYKEIQNVQQTVVTAKRMAYVRSIVRIFKSCDAKLHQLLSTKNGKQMFNEAFNQFLTTIDACVQDEFEATNLIITITDGIAVPESVANLFVAGIQSWQNSSNIGSLMVSCFLNALKVQKIWSLQMFQILESTLVNYMRTSDSIPSYKPSWNDAFERLTLKTDFDIQLLIDSELYLTLYFLSVLKMSNQSSNEDRLDYLLDLQTKISTKKTTDQTESGYCLIWCFVLMSNKCLLKASKRAEQQLLTIAKHLHATYNVNEGWGDGFLGAIGLKKDTQSNEKKTLMLCFSCAIFALISPNSEFDVAINNLTSFLNQKKFSDVKMKGTQAMSIITNKKLSMYDDFTDTISKIVRIFYTNNYFNFIEKMFNW